MNAAVAGSASHHALHKRRVNDLIRESLRDQVSEQPVAFFCECETLRCFESVWLTTAEYEIGRSNDLWSVRAPGHRA